MNNRCILELLPENWNFDSMALHPVTTVIPLKYRVTRPIRMFLKGRRNFNFWIVPEVLAELKV